MTVVSGEDWLRWKPHTKITSYYDLISTSDTSLGLVFHLDNNEETYIETTILFEHSSVLYYRQVDESCRLSSCNLPWTFFMVDNSSLIKELSQESQQPDCLENLLHFSIITDDFFIDVISKKYPIVEVLHD